MLNNLQDNEDEENFSNLYQSLLFRTVHQKKVL